MRLGYAVAGALRYTLGALKLVLPVLLDERRHPAVEQIFGHPMAVVCERWAEVFSHTLWLAEQAQALTRELDLA
jgi:hypothetical protein